jgi:hypothetical protein
MPFSPKISPRRRYDAAEDGSLFSSTEDDEEVCWSSTPGDHRGEGNFLSQDDGMLGSTEDFRHRTQSAVQRHSVFSLKRADYRGLEQDTELLKSIAFWLTSAGDRYVSERNFEDDLADGVALCTVMSKIHGSSVASFHKVAPTGGNKARENWLSFRRSCERLCLPVTFGQDEL